MKKDSLSIIGGQAIWAVSQALLLLIISNKGYIDLVGTTTLSLAIFTPLTLLGSLNLRTLIAIDNEYKISLIDACKLRLIIVVISIIITSTIIFFSEENTYYWIVSTILIASKVPDQISDIATGHYQREKKFNKIGYSFFYRGIAGILPFTILLSLLNNLIYASISSLIFSSIASILHDFNSIKKYEAIIKYKREKVLTILFKNQTSIGWSTFFPVFDSLHINSFRYVIYIFYSPKILGEIGIAQTLFAPIQLIISSMGYKYLTKSKSITDNGSKTEKNKHILHGLVLGATPVIAFLLIAIFVPTNYLSKILPSGETNLKTSILIVGTIMLPLAASSFVALNLLAKNLNKSYTLAPVIGTVLFWLGVGVQFYINEFYNIIGLASIFILSGSIRLFFVLRQSSIY